jgi:hypothetical protein
MEKLCRDDFRRGSQLQCRALGGGGGGLTTMAGKCGQMLVILEVANLEQGGIFFLSIDDL